MEIDTNKNLPTKQEQKNEITNLLNKKVQETDNVKTAIDFMTTKTALEQEGTVEKLVTEKTEELKNDAEAKRVKAETDRTNEEVKKVIAEKEKQIAEFDKLILQKQKEVEQLNADSDKAEAYFQANKEILKYIGVRSKKTLGVMKTLIYPASIIFAIVQILLFPLTFLGVTLETIVNIVGGVCGSIKNNAIKIICSISIILLIIGVIIGVILLGNKIFGA